MAFLGLLQPLSVRLVGIVGLSLLAAGCALSHLQRGDQFAEANRWDEAVSAYREALKEDPFDEDVESRLRRAKVQAARYHYDTGRAAMAEVRVEDAVREFEWAVGFDPSRQEHHVALSDALRLHEARKQLAAAEQYAHMGRLDDALVAYERAVGLDPDLEDALKGITQVTAAQQATKVIAKSSKPITLRFQKAKLREVFEILARTAGVNVVFDKDVRDDPVTIFLKDMPYDDALKLILNTHDLLAHRVADQTILITPNTKQKQAQYQDLMIRTFYLSNALAKNVVNLLRSMLESKRVYADEDVNAVVVRDEPAKIHLAERVIYAVDRRQPEVVLDLEVLEVNRTKSLRYGMNFAKSGAAGVVPPGFTGDLTTAPTRFTFEQLTAIGQSSYLFTLPATVLLDFFKQESDARTLAAPKLRVVNKEKAMINVGDKQPILLSTTNVLPGQAATGAVPTTSTVTSIEFKDTGVSLTVEPVVHLGGELTLKMKVEVTRLGDEVILQDSPEIKQFRFGNRTAETTLRVRDGETVVLAGLISDERRQNQSKVPWLEAIPLLGDLLTATTEDVIETEIVLTITPHVIRQMETPAMEGQLFWSGTQTQFATDPLFTPQPTAVSHQVASSPEQKGGGSAAPSDERPTRPQPQPETPAPLAGTATPLPGPEIVRPIPMPRPGPVPQIEPVAPVPSDPPGPAESPTSAAGAPPRTVVAGGAGVLAIKPARLLTTVGQQFRVDVTADQVGSFTQSELAVSFNPTLVEFVRVSEGQGLTGSAGPSGVAVGGEPASGTLTLRLSRQSGTEAVTGALASLFFRAKAAGTSHLVVQPAKMIGVKGESVPVTARPGAVVIR